MKDVAYEGPTTEEDPEMHPVPIRSKGSPTAPTIRTFHADVAALVESKKTTTLDVITAEKAREQKNQELQTLSASREEHPHHLGRIIFLLLLVLAFGIGVGIYALTSNTVPATRLPKKIASDQKQAVAPKEVTVALDHITHEELFTTIAALFHATVLPDGGTQAITLTITNNAGDAIAATTSTIFSALGVVTQTKIENLVRSLEGAGTYGMYSTGEIVGFFKLRSRSYPETFAGMLAWEPTMAETLLPILNPHLTKNAVALFRGRAFVDKRVAGVPARVLSDPDGVSSLAYAFLPDQKTLLIAGGQEALRGLIEGLQNETP